MTRSAVSNWLKRGTLPADLRPLDNGPDVAPLWPESKLPALAAWYSSRPRVRGRKRTPPRDQQDLLQRLLAYAEASKQAAAVKGHMGFELEDQYWMGAAWAYQDIARLIRLKISS